uniref:Uncharacterized protein n=1 Tax=Zooxanthella nutricula TaxID=1333877 RepID=A0A6U9NCA4_9DINO|mmetsp:Transcript_28088/g.84695  ORF Transcript_28088/g.84695 Transcript_28088/m.84695 type:complete len:139 (+) Transcript_28088:424-840(+)
MARLEDVDGHVQQAANALAGGPHAQTLSLQEVYEREVIRGSDKCQSDAYDERKINWQRFENRFKKTVESFEENQNIIDLDTVLPCHTAPPDQRANYVGDQTFAQASDRCSQAINFIKEALYHGRIDGSDSALRVLLDR